MKLIEKRAIKEDVDNLERRLQDQIQEILHGLIDRFADKKETAKKIAFIEKQLKALFDMMMNMDTNRAGG